MNNEPVAIVELGGEITWLTDVLPYKAKLYTHPVKEQLTEEQVIDITKAFFNIHPETQLSEKFSIPLYELTHFAKAILRKAQEK